ncbi:MAG: DUF2306 domain-containing protein [Acidobacteriota bacterium]
MTPASRRPPPGDRLLRGASVTLAATTWISGLLFGLYILAFYVASLSAGNAARWNERLPGLYDPDRGAATVGIGAHFAAGGVILILGCVQLLGGVRARYPGLHRWTGRLYVSAALLAATGGLLFIAVKGTIGGPVMNVGFSLYGILMLVAAVETLRHARAGAFDRHRAWALRLYALAIGSWLYRMDYGFWFMLVGKAGHTSDFRGAFDYFMAFFFYLPNLLVVEIFLRSQGRALSPTSRGLATVALLATTAFLSLGTYYFTRYQWGPAIVGWLTF